jgi:hypothetical protein
LGLIIDILIRKNKSEDTFVKPRYYAQHIWSSKGVTSHFMEELPYKGML